MRIRSALVLALPGAALLALLGFGRPAGASKPPPPQLVVTSVTTDLEAAPCLMTLRGRGFGEDELRLRLGGEEIVVLDHDEDWALAEFACGLEAGDHLLEAWRGPSTTDRDVLSLTLGAVGPRGPQGPVGSEGPPGPVGPPGLLGVEIVEFRWPLLLENFQILEFDCPAGQRVLSGGWRGWPENPPFAQGLDIWHSYPVDEDTWSFQIGPRTAGLPTDLGDFFLVCATLD